MKVLNKLNIRSMSLPVQFSVLLYLEESGFCPDSGTQARAKA